MSDPLELELQEVISGPTELGTEFKFSSRTSSPGTILKNTDLFSKWKEELAYYVLTLLGSLYILSHFCFTSIPKDRDD